MEMRDEVMATGVGEGREESCSWKGARGRVLLGAPLDSVWVYNCCTSCCNYLVTKREQTEANILTMTQQKNKKVIDP